MQKCNEITSVVIGLFNLYNQLPLAKKMLSRDFIMCHSAYKG